MRSSCSYRVSELTFVRSKRWLDLVRLASVPCVCNAGCHEHPSFLHSGVQVAGRVTLSGGTRHEHVVAIFSRVAGVSRHRRDPVTLYRSVSGPLTTRSRRWACKQRGSNSGRHGMGRAVWLVQSHLCVYPLFHPLSRLHSARF